MLVQYGPGDTVGLILAFASDKTATLTAVKNGQELGVLMSGLTGPLCWSCELFRPGDSVTISSADGAKLF